MRLRRVEKPDFRTRARRFKRNLIFRFKRDLMLRGIRRQVEYEMRYGDSRTLVKMLDSKDLRGREHKQLDF